MLCPLIFTATTPSRHEFLATFTPITFMGHYIMVCIGMLA
jgi:hypothetical protein